MLYNADTTYIFYKISTLHYSPWKNLSSSRIKYQLFYLLSLPGSRKQRFRTINHYGNGGTSELPLPERSFRIVLTFWSTRPERPSNIGWWTAQRSPEETAPLYLHRFMFQLTGDKNIPMTNGYILRGKALFYSLLSF